MPVDDVLASFGALGFSASVTHWPRVVAGCLPFPTWLAGLQASILAVQK